MKYAGNLGFRFMGEQIKIQYIQTIEYHFSHVTEENIATCNNMGNLEDTTLSEASQTPKDKN